MTPELRQDRSGLRWIRSDLDQTLREARTALEDFVDGQAERIGVTIEQMHHVHGALEMVQVYGGAMLADEMEQLAVALSQGRVKGTEAAAEALMLGIVQLPGYLEKIEAGGADVPLLLLPLLNDIRAAHDAPLVSETSLFAPKLDAVIAAETVRPGSGNRDLPELIHHQRSHFHRALLHWIRGEDEHHALAQLHDVLDLLNSAAGTARLRRLLDAGQALTLVLREDEEAPALAVKPLFGKLDRVFKQIIDQGEEVAMLDFPVELLKNLLYYVARSSSTDPGVVAVRQSAELANSFADNQAGGATDPLGGPDRELFAAVGEALAQDLRDVKDRLDLFMRSDRGEFARVTGLATSIQRIGDTLGMVGRGELRTRLKHRCDELRAAEAAGQAPPDDRLMLLASDLLFVESSLSSLETAVAQEVDVDAPMQGVYAQSFSEGEMNLHFRAALDEAMVEIARTKDAILQYLDNPQLNNAIDDVPQRLQAVSGALRVLELKEPAELLGALAPYFRVLAGGEREAPSAAECDAIADVVIGAECYMQAAVEPGEDRTRVLGYAQAALARLGVEPGEPGPAGTSVETLPDEPGERADLVDAPNVIAFPGAAAEPAASPDSAAPALVETTPSEPAVQGPDTSVSTAEPAPEAPAADDFGGVDPEILEVFAEEAEEELGVIQTQYPMWRDDRANKDALTTMRRSYHTLKGSGRLVGANNIGEFAWSIENLLNRVIDGTVADGPEVIQVLDDALAVLPALVDEAKTMTPGGTDVSELSARAFALAAGEPPAAVAQPETPAERSDDAAPLPDVSDVADAQAAEAAEPAVPVSEAVPEPPRESATVAAFDAAGDEESILTASEAEDSVLTETEALTEGAGDTSLNAVFIDEAHQHIAVLGEFLERRAADPEHTLFDDELRRAMHTLRGCSKTAGLDSMAELAGTLEDLGNVMVSLERPVDDALNDLLTTGHRMLSDLATSVEAPPVAPVEWQSLRDRLRGFIDDLSHRAPDLEQQHAEAADAELESVDPELLEVFLEEARELLESLETELADWQSAAGDLQPVAQLQRTLHTMKGGARLAGVTAIGDLSHALESVFEGLTERRIDDSNNLQQLVRHATDVVAQYVEQLMRGHVPRPQPALNERLEAASRGATWEPIGAADAMVGAAVDADEGVRPATETVPSEDHDTGPVEGPIAAADVEESVHDADVAFEEIAAIEEPDEPESETEILTDSQLMTDSELLRDSSYLSEETTAVDSHFSDLVTDDSTVVHFPASEQLDEKDGFVPRRPMPAQERATSGTGERVRVPSEALDQMVNNAGEVSIYRARIEQQNTTFAFNLGELQQTIDRLRSQLRALELETEAQVLSRHERESDSRADFDPLELDRYSTMQQLSRALSETVEDLSNLGHSLTELSRDTDTLLLQQARVNTDLQDSLLRTRMVKFSSRVPRLERVVRQTAHGLGKQAALKVTGGYEDMDRAILERMMSPLEHLLRNAVSHGIEDSNTRLANGKPEEGSISLQLAREGSDIVLTLADDGAGLDRARIRAKAVERGLVDSDAVVEDDQLYQMILQPGFSTAEELSQVSGRGVGMDVVLTEVKQLGGTLDIGSEPGHGTRFTIRLPFTLAITDSLLVTLGDDIYAVPHSSMDGVVRVPVDELRAIYAGEREVFSYADRDYSLRYLGTMLGTQAPSLPDGVRWLPVLLVRSGEHRVAIQVDGLLGNRQVVVKSVGAQLSSVRWFTGGTILADGQIALILDINSLVRRDLTQVAQPVQPAATPAAKGVSVMVVDDSITVRKVTSRLLERHNMQVFTAKDGVDAVTQLQEQRPDVMLLDIEMPRMDGYELARHMRSTPELSDIPIIMITSRSGEKHRDRAFELGVKRYLGKPYQEGDLLENIYTVLAESAL
jgi:chemosensory pili system protein ChpA (sensor histidine kinase/response regulator)